MLRVFILVYLTNPTRETKINLKLFEQDAQVCFSVYTMFIATFTLGLILWIFRTFPMLLNLFLLIIVPKKLTS